MNVSQQHTAKDGCGGAGATRLSVNTALSMRLLRRLPAGSARQALRHEPWVINERVVLVIS